MIDIAKVYRTHLEEQKHRAFVRWQQSGWRDADAHDEWMRLYVELQDYHLKTRKREVTVDRLKMKPVDMAEKLRAVYDRLAERGLVERRNSFAGVEVHDMPDGSIEVSGPLEAIRTLRRVHQYMPSRTRIRRWDAHREALHKYLPITCRQRQRNARRNLKRMGVEP